jgi:hypothetical protein
VLFNLFDVTWGGGGYVLVLDFPAYSTLIRSKITINISLILIGSWGEIKQTQHLLIEIRDNKTQG